VKFWTNHICSVIYNRKFFVVFLLVFMLPCPVIMLKSRIGRVNCIKLYLLSTLIICLFLSREYIVQDTRCCCTCGLMFPCKTMKKVKGSSYALQYQCKLCAKVIQNGLLYSLQIFHKIILQWVDDFKKYYILLLQLLKSKQYCGICKKIWHHSDGGNWVRCLFCQFCFYSNIYFNILLAQ
jgi:hypothetical protein